MTIENDAELANALERMKKSGTDCAQWEVKASGHDFPQSVPETISAFANTHGGTLILGVSEKNFLPVDNFDVKRIQTALAHALRESVQPKINADIHVLEYKGAHLLVANIPELPPRDKPCYVKKHGQMNGSFIRTGDGDHRMTTYEIDRFQENQLRSAHNDANIVTDATLDDLDLELTRTWLQRVRETSFGRIDTLDDKKIMANRRIISPDSQGVLRPTIAGIMALGTYPQQFFPRLNVVFSVYPSSIKADANEAIRLIDSANFDGPIPEMILATLRAISRNMRRGAIVHEGLREDIHDYPLPAIREAVANALMHRDYSTDAHGMPVCIDLYPDRLEITNPGGLYGPLTVETLGTSGGTYSRNQFLSRILEDVSYTDSDGRVGHVVENRGTGYPTIINELEKALMPKPVIRSELSRFTIIFRHRRMTSSENTYSSSNARVAILNYLDKHESATTAELAAASGLSSKTIRVHINHLMDEKQVEGIGQQYSPRRRYRLAGK